MKKDINKNKALSQTCVMQSVLKASDCRFGNYIEYGGSITQLNEKEMCHFFRFPETYKPIPLTEDWLLKFGFKIENCYENNKASKNKIIITYGENFFYGITRLIYVHELQNLYFALTKTELSWQNLEK